MSTESNEQYREGFEACPFCGAELEPFGPDQANHPRNDCWLSSVSVQRHEFARWNRRAKSEASTEPSAEPSGDAGELVRQLRITAGMVTMCERISWVEHISVLNRAANFIEATGALTDDAKDSLRDALNTTLWLYRRLPHAYNKPPFVDAAILTMAKHLGMDDMPAAIKERAEMVAQTKAGSGK